MFLYEICSLLERGKVPYAVVGGHAVALHGAVRGTVDIDIVIKWSKTHLKKTERILKEYGLESRLPIAAEDIYEFRDEYIKNKNLTAWNFYHPQQQNEQVNIIINYDLQGKKTKLVKIPGGKIRILELSELIDMKTLSSREQDKHDVNALKKLKERK